MRPLVFHFPDDRHIAAELVDKLDAEAGTLEWHRFPDGESLITLHGDCVERDVIVICTLTDPDAKSLALHFSSRTAYELGARGVGLVAPYLSYMRQDHRFRPGQALSASAYAKLLSTAFDWLVTVDPHLHRIKRLEEIYSIPAVAVSSMPAVSEWIGSHVQDPILIGPDRESAQWVEHVAHSLDAPWVVLDKVRSGDREVRVSALDPAILRGRHPVIVDDIASSGKTLVEVLKQLSPLGAEDATCVIVHALLAPGADESLRLAGARRVVSTNTVTHPTNAIDIVPLLAAAIDGLLGPK
jgi:ribose-phosphate pyrophosphokinase